MSSIMLERSGIVKNYFELPCPKYTRDKIRGARAMTCIAGLHFAGGIVLAAETEVSTPYDKFHSAKISSVSTPKYSLAVAVAGVWEKANTVADDLLETIASQNPNVDTLKALVATKIAQAHRNIGLTEGQDDYIGLLIGFQVANQPDQIILKVSGNTVRVVGPWDCWGSGAIHARYVLKRLYKSDLDIVHAAALCAYVIQTAKVYAVGCEGATQVEVLTPSGELHVHEKGTETLGELFGGFEEKCRAGFYETVWSGPHF